MKKIILLCTALIVQPLHASETTPYCHCNTRDYDYTAADHVACAVILCLAAYGGYTLYQKYNNPPRKTVLEKLHLKNPSRTGAAKQVARFFSTFDCDESSSDSSSNSSDSESPYEKDTCKKNKLKQALSRVANAFRQSKNPNK